MPFGLKINKRIMNIGVCECACPHSGDMEECDTSIQLVLDTVKQYERNSH